MDTEQLRKRLGRSDRGNRDWTSGRVKIGVRSRNRPGPWESAELACVDCKIEWGKQLSREHRGVESWIKLSLRCAQCFRLSADFKTRLLQASIIGARKRERFVERQNFSTASLCVCAKGQAHRCR